MQKRWLSRIRKESFKPVSRKYFTCLIFVTSCWWSSLKSLSCSSNLSLRNLTSSIVWRNVFKFLFCCVLRIKIKSVKDGQYIAMTWKLFIICSVIIYRLFCCYKLNSIYLISTFSWKNKSNLMCKKCKSLFNLLEIENCYDTLATATN